MKILFFLSAFALMASGCQKDIKTQDTPGITTAAITLVTPATASSGGHIDFDGGTPVTARGVCWSTSPNPNVTGNHTIDGTGIGTFISNITGLVPNTTYYLRSYATNSAGTAYGNELSFSTSSPDVFVAGYEGIGMEVFAKVWKNGIPTTLGNTNAVANSVFVSGSDVYVAGSEYDAEGYSFPIFWKNDVGTRLSDVPNSNAYSVAVSGADVYVAGEDNLPTGIIAQVWKNGVAIPLNIGPIASFANTVYISGTDIFTGGSYYSAQRVYNAAVWKNEVPLLLTSGRGIVTALFVSGPDVYAVGVEHNGTRNVPKIWKNGVGSSLTDGTYAASVHSVFVSGTDVYAVGGEKRGTHNTATIWKNGIVYPLTDGSNDAVAYSVYVSGEDVYVTGYESNGSKEIAKIWKNGVATSLTDGSQWARGESIFVK